MVTLGSVREWLIRLSEIYSENKNYLTDLDSAIGDADHGINLDRGFSAVRADIEKNEYSSIRDLLKAEAMMLIKTVGGASGPLLGTFFLQMSKTVSSDDGIDGKEIVSLFRAGLEGIKMRGHAAEGEKTMIDTWSPAVSAMEEALSENCSVGEILSRGKEAAWAGMNSTIEMLATKGRASYLGERSIGHLDPGAASSFMMIKAACDLWT